MDYQGNYFPEEHDENESKIYRAIKGTIKWTMYGISFLLYIIFFVVIVVNRDSYILEKNYMNELPEFENVDTDDIELYRINSKFFMTEDGSIQLHNIDYSEEHGIMEIGIKYNATKDTVTKGERGDAIEYVLTDNHGNRYSRVKHVIDSAGRYEYARVCFSGIDIVLDENDLRQEGDNQYGKGTLYQLTLYRKSDGYKLHTFDLYDNTVTFYPTDFND